MLRIGRWTLAAVVVVGGACAAGCLVGGSSAQVRSGNYVAQETWTQIKPGETTAGWLTATLGEPDARTPVPGQDAEIWKWAYTEKTNSSGYVFLIFGGHDSKETTGAAFVELRDGTVFKKWRG